MDRKILEWLRCPLTNSKLQLLEIDVEALEERDLVRTGILWSGDGGFWYPVINFVPVMLTFRTGTVDRFSRDYAEQLSSITGARKPDANPHPGEKKVQATFTEEWAGTGHADVTFGYNFDELREMHRSWLYLGPEGDTNSKLVLNVGCGHGQESMVLSDLFPNADILGMDVNLSLLAAAPGLLKYPNVHLVVASLFSLPFADGEMDHVHSQGVIHHTYDTKRAFDSIEPKVKPDGSIFIWVYADEDLASRKGLLGWTRNRIRGFNDAVTRPILANLPSSLRTAAINILAVPTHPIFRKYASHPDLWSVQNTRHVLRDAFTPPYIHRHGFNEMIQWFQNCGYDFYVSPAGRIQEITGRHYRGVGMVGRRNGEPVIPGIVAKKKAEALHSE